MKKAVVLGHFGFGHDKTNGQTIKTKIVGNELRRVFGEDEVDFEDTMGGWRFLLRLPLQAYRMLRHHADIIFLPAYKGVHIIIPLLAFLNKFFRRRLHYVVIGGWLPGYVRKYPILRRALHHVDNIFVETQFMRSELESAGLTNVIVMPNCKELKPIELIPDDAREQRPLRLCTFSRVMQMKGIGNAVEAVVRCNRQAGQPMFKLDIYGPVEEQEWFDELMKSQPAEIRYCGIVPYQQSMETLQHYFALLFPTLFPTEGFAGTIIDALAAGLPIIASDCPSNKELIAEGTTGILYPATDVDALTEILQQIAQQPDIINAMRPNCIAEATDYQPENVIRTLTDRMKS